MKERILSSNEKQISLVYFWWISVRIFMRKNIVTRFRNFKSRRPHRSFRISKRRDFARPLNIDGYWRMASDVFRLIRENKKMFACRCCTHWFNGSKFYFKLTDCCRHDKWG